MLRILHDTKYDFIRWWRVMAGLTIAFIVIGLVALFFEGGFNYSVDFTGGTLLQVRTSQPVHPDQLRKALETGGVLMPLAQLQRIPKPGDYFDFQGRRFTVLDMDGRRIARVLIELLKEAAGART